jgi:2-haloacid dehalogenase
MSQQQITAVVFDLGGVLLDWNPRHLYRRLFADPGEMEDFLARICTPDWHRAHDLGEDVAESCRRLAGQHPRHRDMIMAWVDPGDEMAAGQIDGAVDVLAELKAASVRCLVLSNMEPATFASRLGRFPFMNWFDGYVISGLEGLAKPDPRIFQLLLRRHRLEPAATVFIDDSPVNVEAARGQGMAGVRYTSAGELRNQLRALGLTNLNAPHGCEAGPATRGRG